MLKVDDNGMCFQCEEFKQVVSFKDAETSHENKICEDCLNDYLDGKIAFE
jgi:hypothetical protein